MSERITVSCELFVDFIKKSTLEGEIPQLLLKQTENGYEVGVMAENVISCTGLILKKNFVMYGKVGDITIKNVKMFIELIKDMKDNITIEKKEDRIIIHGDKVDVEYILCSEEFIETTLPEPVTIDFDDGFKIPKDFFLSLVSKAKLFDVSSLTLKVEKKVLKGVVEDNDKYIVKEEVPYKDCESDYGRWIYKLANYMEDKVVVSFDTNYPIRVISKNSNFELNYIIAPFVKTDVVEEEDEGKEKDKDKKDKKDG